jgi:hypothetical protein
MLEHFCAPVSFFGDPRHAHAFIDALALRKIGRIVSRRTSAETADGESRIESKSRLYRCPRIIQPPQMRQRGGQKEVRARGGISVGLDGSPERGEG